MAALSKYQHLVSPEPAAYTPLPEGGSNLIVLDELAWKQFIEAVEAPAREIPALVELFRAKAPWD
jgi:hypothetical protein